MPLTLTRSLLVILIPGLIALAPWLLWLVDNSPASEEFYRDCPQLVWGVLFVAATIFGTVQEILCSRIEVEWDKAREKKYRVEANWFDYLARICEAEPVGHAYLSRMATSMYFELTMTFAVLFCGIGVTLLFHLWTLKWWFALLVIGVSLGISLWFFMSAWESHEVLCRTRQEINKRLGPVTPRP